MKGPATALLNEIVVEALPPAATGIDNGATVNSVAVGAVQVTVAASVPGFWNWSGAVVAAPPSVKDGSAIVEPDAGVEVNGGWVPAGHDSVKVTAVGVPPRFSLQVRVCVATAAPRVQVPASGEPVIAPGPTAVTVWPKPANGAVGAVQVVVVVAAAPAPTPGVPIDTAIEALPVEPIVVPPVNATVDAAAGV